MAETPFKLKSGNTTSFKQMGSTPVKDKKEYGPYSYHHNTQKATKEHYGDPHGPAPTKQIDWEAIHAKAITKDPRYGELSLEDYITEAKRQSAHYKKTGKWDAMGVYDSKGKKKSETPKIESNDKQDVDKKKEKLKKRNLIQKIGDELKKGHKQRKISDKDYKENKKAGESKWQYNRRKSSEKSKIDRYTDIINKEDQNSPRAQRFVRLRDKLTS